METFVSVPILIAAQPSSEPVSIENLSWNQISLDKESTEIDAGLTDRLQTDQHETLVMVNFLNTGEGDSLCLQGSVPQGLDPPVLQLVSAPSLENNLSKEIVLNTCDDELFDQISVTMTIYKCRFCSFQTSSKLDLKKHVTDEHLKNATSAHNVSREEDNSETNERLAVDNAPSNQADDKKSEETKCDEGSNMEQEEEKLVYLCAKCSKAFMTFSDCKTHMHTMHSSKPSSDDSTQKESDGTTPVRVLEKKRKKTQSDVKHKIKCPVSGCTVRLKSKDDIEKHKTCHVDIETSPSSFCCPHCHEVFVSSWPNFLNHIWRSHCVDMGLYSCKVCEYKTAFREKCDEHEKIHQSEKHYKCLICSKAFKQRTQLRNHEVAHFKGKSGGENGNREEKTPNWCKPKECDQCKKMFSDVKSLKKHVQAVHSKLKPYVCHVCGHGSAHKHMMRMHMRQHSGEKPYSCHICTFSTGDHNSLRRHIMRHNGIKPYQCQHCSYAAVQSSSLKNHMATRHPGLSGIYSCAKCSFETVSAKSFAHHRHQEAPESSKTLDSDSPVQVIYVPPKNGDSKNSGHLIAINFKTDEEDESDHLLDPVVDNGGITIPEDPSFLRINQ